MRSPLKGQHRGFTLVELLVVIAIIAILVALLLPAVNAAREAARASQCRNNMKQIALALLNFESATRKLPPSSTWPTGTVPETKSNVRLGPNWVILILPYMEEQALHSQFKLNQPINDPVNQQQRGATIPTMLCPTDSDRNGVRFDGTGHAKTAMYGDGWARGNYAANGSLGYLQHLNGIGAAFANSREWKSPMFRGVMGANVGLKIGQIKDGTSKTILVGEIRAGVVPIDPRGVWAMGGACPSSLWAHGYNGDDNGPNNLGLFADDPISCSAIRTAFGGERMLAQDSMGCSTIDAANIQQTMRSRHAGGVHAALVDGSVHFLSDSIQVSTNNRCCSVWDRINLSADALPIEGEVF